MYRIALVVLLSHQVLKLKFCSGSTSPFLYPCNSTTQCSNTIYHSCNMQAANLPQCWFCDCWFGGQPCNVNEDCCTNICNRGRCTYSGGTQGCVCVDSLAKCAPGYNCVACGTFSYCDSIIKSTTNFITSSTYHLTMSTSIVTTRSSSVGTSAAITTSDHHFHLPNCTNHPDGDYENPLEPCSHFYYTCANGYTYLRECPSTLYFDQDEDKCLAGSLVPACNK